MLRRYRGPLLARAARTRVAAQVVSSTPQSISTPNPASALPTSLLSTSSRDHNVDSPVSKAIPKVDTVAVFRSTVARWMQLSPEMDTWLTLTPTNRIDIKSQLWELERLVLLPSESDRYILTIKPTSWTSALSSTLYNWGLSKMPASPPLLCPIADGLREALSSCKRELTDEATGVPGTFYQDPTFKSKILALYERVLVDPNVCHWEVGVRVALNAAMVCAHQGDYSTATGILEECQEVLRALDVSAAGTLCALLLHLCKAGEGDFKGALDVLRREHSEALEGRGLAKNCAQYSWGSVASSTVEALRPYFEMTLGRALLELDQPEEALAVLSGYQARGDPVNIGLGCAMLIYLARAQSRSGHPREALSTLTLAGEQSRRPSSMGASAVLEAVGTGSQMDAVVAHLATGVVRVGPVGVLCAELEAAYLYHTNPAVSCHTHAHALYMNVFDNIGALQHRCSPLSEDATTMPLPTLFRQVFLPLQELFLEVAVGLVMCCSVQDIGSETVASSVEDAWRLAHEIGLSRCVVAVSCVAVQSHGASGNVQGAMAELDRMRHSTTDGLPVRQFMGGGVRKYMDPSQVDGINALYTHHYAGDIETARPMYVSALRGCLGPNTKTSLLDGRNAMPVDVQCLVLEGYANALRHSTTSLEDLLEALTVLDRRIQLGSAMGDSSIRVQLMVIGCLADVIPLMAAKFEADDRAVQIGVLIDDVLERVLKELLHFHNSALLPTQKYEITRKYAQLAYTNSKFALAAKFFEAAVSLHDGYPMDYVLCGFCHANKPEPSLSTASRMYNTAHALVALRVACAEQAVQGGLKAEGPAGATIVYSDTAILAECAKFSWYHLKDPETAEELYIRALQLRRAGDPDLPVVLVDYANMRFAAYGDVLGAEELFLEAKQLMPTNVQIQLSYLDFLFSAMRIPELLKQVKIAMGMELVGGQLDQLWLSVARAEQMVNPQDVAAVSAAYYQHLTGDKLDVDPDIVPEEAMLTAIRNSKAETGPIAYTRYLLDRTFALPFALQCLDTIVSKYPESDEAGQLRDELISRTFESSEDLRPIEEKRMDAHLLCAMGEACVGSPTALVNQLLEQAGVISRRYPDRPEEAERFYLQAVHIERSEGLRLTARSHYAKWLINTDHLSPKMALTMLEDLFRGVGVVSDGSAAEASLEAVGRNSNYDPVDAQFLADMHTCYAAVLGALASTIVPFKESLSATPVTSRSHMELLDHANRHFDAALRLHGKGASVHLEYGTHLMAQRSFKAGVAHLQRSLELDPTNAANLIHATTLMINYSISLINDNLQRGAEGSLSDPGTIKDTTSLTTRWIHASLMQCPCNVALIECVAAYEEALSLYDPSQVGKSKATAKMLRSMQASQETSLRAVRRRLLSPY